MKTVQIIGAPQSNFVRVVRLVAEEKGAPYELVAAMPHTPEVTAIHPLGKIPVMRHGDVELCESRAIAHYLDAALPGRKLMPSDPLEAAKIEQWVSMMITAYDPAFRPYLGAYFFPGTADGSPDRPRIEASMPKIEELLTKLDSVVAPTGHVVGDSFSLADIYLLPLLSYLKDLPESGAVIAKLPNLSAYIRRHDERASMKATVSPPFPRREAA